MIMLNVPMGLSALIAKFAEAMAAKMLEADKKYNHGDSWAERGWMDECRLKLREHVDKGDARDVALYAAFLWYHGEKTNLVEGEVKANARAVLAIQLSQKLSTWSAWPIVQEVDVLGATTAQQLVMDWSVYWDIELKFLAQSNYEGWHIIIHGPKETGR